MTTPDKNNKKKGPVYSEATVPDKKSSKIVPFFITFCVMMIMWVIFSGRFDAFHLTLGLISSLIVAGMSSDLLIKSTKIMNIPGQWGRFFLYFPWLLWRIFLANLHVLKLVFHPNMIHKINPHIVEFRSGIKNDMGLVTLANSITLTPGTITVALSPFGDFKVHAIDDDSAADLPGEMETKIARIFGE